MDIRKVKKLIEMLENSNLEEIEIQEGEESVRLVKSNGNVPNNSQSHVIGIPEVSSAKIETEEMQSIESEDQTDGDFIKSPMV